MMTIYDGRKSFYQWDVNQKLTSPNLAEGDEVHFSNAVLPRALVVKAYVLDGVIVADVPNILLQEALTIKVFRYITDADSRHTCEAYSFSVVARPMPEDYIYTETEILNYKFLEERLQQLEEYGVSEAKLDKAVVKYFDKNPIEVEESDPTVPEWAKAKEKPTYTADEVGALSKDTPIPPIRYVESLNFTTLETLVPIRSLESNTYILYGRFVPFSGSDEVLVFSSGMLASIIKRNVVTYMQIFYPEKNTVQYFEITDNECLRTNTDLVNMESIENKVTSMDDKSNDDQYPSARAVFEALSKKEDAENKVDEIPDRPADEHYPTAKAVKIELDKKEDTANKVTEISEFSTDEQYPTAKSVYDWGKEHETVDNKVTAIDDKSKHEEYPTAKAVHDFVKSNAQSVSDGSVPRMSIIDDADGNNVVEEYKDGKTFANSYNRVYVELSRGRGVSARYCLTAGTNVPLDPDPEDYANGKKLDSIPLRMDDGFIRVPTSEYGKTQPTIGDDNYDENQRAMSKKYIDTGIEKCITDINGRVKKAVTTSATANQVYGELSGDRGSVMYPICNGPTFTSDHVPQRTKDGLLRCNTPDDGSDTLCANKGYVDKRFNGANKSLAYSNYSTMITAFNSLAKDAYNVGQNIMIVTLDVPDLWISAVSTSKSTYTYSSDETFVTALKSNGSVKVGYYTLSMLETQKVDLTNYPTSAQFQALYTEVDKKLNDGVPQFRNNNYIYETGLWLFAIRTAGEYQSLGIHYIFSDKVTNINGRTKGGIHFSIVIGTNGSVTIYNGEKNTNWSTDDGYFEIYATRLDNPS